MSLRDLFIYHSRRSGMPGFREGQNARKKERLLRKLNVVGVEAAKRGVDVNKLINHLTGTASKNVWLKLNTKELSGLISAIKQA